MHYMRWTEAGDNLIYTYISVYIYIYGYIYIYILWPPVAEAMAAGLPHATDGCSNPQLVHWQRRVSMIWLSKVRRPNKGALIRVPDSALRNPKAACP